VAMATEIPAAVLTTTTAAPTPARMEGGTPATPTAEAAMRRAARRASATTAAIQQMAAAVIAVAVAMWLGCGGAARPAGAQPAHPDEGARANKGSGAKAPSKSRKKKRAASTGSARSGSKDDAQGNAGSGGERPGAPGDGGDPTFDEDVVHEVGAVQRGESVWYGARFHGKPTASGERFDRRKMTAAHRTLPMGTMVRVTRAQSDASVVVRINDRGPFGKRRERIIDVSEAAARALGIIEVGRAPITLEVLTLPASRKDKD
jgi:rare lipoprotein A